LAGRIFRAIFGYAKGLEVFCAIRFQAFLGRLQFGEAAAFLLDQNIFGAANVPGYGVTHDLGAFVTSAILSDRCLGSTFRIAKSARFRFSGVRFVEQSPAIQSCR
jgi:hypothetical protein